MLALLVVHVLFCLARVPHSVFAKRHSHIERLQRQGPTRFFFRDRYEGAADIEWLLHNTPPESVVLWRGPWRGPLELAAPLLRPRLLLDQSAIRPGDLEFAGRPLASGTRHGQTGVLILTSTTNGLRVTVR